MECCTFDNNVIIHKIVKSDDKIHSIAKDFFNAITTSIELRGVLLSSVENEFFSWCMYESQILMKISYGIIKAKDGSEREKYLKEMENEMGRNIVQYFRRYFLQRLLKTRDVGSVTGLFFPQLMHQFYKIKKNRNIEFKKIYVPDEKILEMFREFPTLKGSEEEKNDARHLWSTIKLKEEDYAEIVSFATWDEEHLHKIKEEVRNKYHVNIKYPEEFC